MNVSVLEWRIEFANEAWQLLTGCAKESVHRRGFWESFKVRRSANHSSACARGLLWPELIPLPCPALTYPALPCPALPCQGQFALVQPGFTCRS
jgi:hypothetical protein